MDSLVRLDNYRRQNGSDMLTPKQSRRVIHKERHATGSDGHVWIYAPRAKNRPTPRRRRRRG